MSENIQWKIERIRAQYDPENNLGPRAMVTSADYELLGIVEEQQTEIVELGIQIDEMHSQISALQCSVDSREEQI